MGDVIFTVEEKCVGCNKCIRSCPFFGANVSYAKDGEYKVSVDQDRCIRCGACLTACSHGARQYADDTERFFSDLSAGRRISVVVAPAARTNFGDPRKLISWLKSLGVNLAYDVSFGADITTWAYLKAIRERSLDSVIAQPCPAIVNYIEKYEPALLSRLAPVHSPTLCTAVYLRKYAKIDDAIAFLSPCIAKTDEFTDSDTNGLVEYNVTYARLYEWAESRNIDLDRFAPREYDDMGCWLGAVYSRPGGLRENVEALVQGAWVRQVEGTGHAYPYLSEYRARAGEGKPLPLLVDVLNCAHGCNLGTASRKGVAIDDADLRLNEVKRTKTGKRRGKAGGADLMRLFDRKLELGDFLRSYTDRSVSLSEPGDRELEAIWSRLHKERDADRYVDCSACGYDTCREMALAIYNGFNEPANCIRFNQREIEIESESIRDKTRLIERLADYTRRIVALLDEIAALNLDVSVTGSFEGDFAAIRDAIDSISLTLSATVREIQRAADQFGAGAEHVSFASASLAKGTAEQASAVERLSSLLGLLTEETKRNADNAEKARALTASSRESAEEGNRRMAELLRSMEAINESSADINKILATIDDIAFQTNILALNAAIEAARAGKYGKSFSVVADEVRLLAGRCSAAAKESSELIASSGYAVDSGTKIARETAESLEAIVKTSGDTAFAVDEIANTSGEQSRGIDKINESLRQVSLVVQANSASAQESAATSQELSSQAELLRKSVARFRLRPAAATGTNDAADFSDLLAFDSSAIEAALARIGARSGGIRSGGARSGGVRSGGTRL